MEVVRNLHTQALTRSIEASSLSEELKAMAAANEFKSFADVVNYGVGRIPELLQGNHRLLVELLGWLEENGLLELADKIQEVDS
jgi:hypothetical protein